MPLAHRAFVVLACLLTVSAATAVADDPAGEPELLPPPRVAPGMSVFRHGRPVSAIAFSPDGKVLASAGWDRIIRLWDVATGKGTRQLEGHTAEIECVAFAPHGKVIASGGWDAAIRLWDSATGKEIRQIGEHPDGIFALAFSPDGKTIASGNQDRGGRQGILHVWDVATSKELLRLQGHTSPVTSVAFSADGKTLASGSMDRTIRLWDTGTGKMVRELERHDNWVFAVAFSPDGEHLASAGADSTIRLWDTSDGKQVRIMAGHEDKVRSIAFSTDGKTIVSGSIDRTVRLWEVATGQERRVLRSHNGGVRSVAVAPGGAHIASGSTDVTARMQPLFDLADLPAKLSERELEELWAGLAHEDSKRGYESVLRLSAAAPQSLPLLQKQFEGRARIEEERVGGLIADLDADKFAVRERASQELEKLGDLAESALKRVLGGKPPLEVRLRVEALLEKVRGPIASPERLRLSRAVEILEYSGTREARKTLWQLADGPANARITREAKAAMDRLAKRGLSSP